MLYSKVFFATDNPIPTGLVQYFHCLNNDILLTRYEDGAINYFRISTSQSDKLMKLYDILRLPRLYEITKDYCLYNDNLQLYKETGIQINKISAAASKGDENDLMLHVFGNTENIQADIIFFSQNINLEINLITKIAKSFPEKKIALKLHPEHEMVNVECNNIEIITQTDMPWEIMCRNMDLRKIILISLRSTVLFTPKYMFDMEPKLIFMYKLVEEMNLDMAEIEGAIYDLRECYTSKELVSVPEDEKEMIDEIRKSLFL